MKIALVHDYLSQDGGAERVLKAFSEIWPDASIFVLMHDRKKITYFDKEKIRQSFLAFMPLNKKMFQWNLPLMPLATERHNLHEFDLVLSSASSFAKGVLTRPNTLHISYCHTPPRFLWTDTHEYANHLNHRIIAKTLLPRLLHKLRLWDKMSVDRVDHFIANSHTVRRRIKKYYRRECEVIHPPIDMDSFKFADKVENYFLAGGRLVGYKRLDIVIKAFNRLGLPLKIFGDGPELKKLKKIAKRNIEFLHRISEKDKINLLGKAKAFIHPQLEDFGITPLESMACGRPVIAYDAGGATETVIHNKTGILFQKQTTEHLIHAILNFNKHCWDKCALRSHAYKFDSAKFKEKIKHSVNNRYDLFKKGLKHSTNIQCV